MAEVLFVFFQPCSHFLHGRSRFFHLYCLVDKQTFPERCTQRIHYDDLSVRIFLFQFFCCQPHTVIASAQSGRKCQMQHIISRFQNRTKYIFRFLTVDLRCHRHGTRPHPVVKLFYIQFIFFVVCDTFQLVSQIHIFYLMFFVIRIRQISSIVCRNYIVFHKLSSFGTFFSFYHYCSPCATFSARTSLAFFICASLLSHSSWESSLNCDGLVNSSASSGQSTSTSGVIPVPWMFTPFGV